MDLPVSLTALGLAYGLVFIGAVLQGSLGFGLGTFAVPLLLLIDPFFVPGPLLCLAFALTLLIYRRNRGDVRTQDLKWGIGGRLIGSLLAAALLTVVPAAYLSLLIGSLVLLALGLIAGGFRVPITAATLVGVGALSGLMGTAASIGGPPMAMLYYDQRGPRIRGTLSGIFIVGTLIGLLTLAAVGRLGVAEMLVALCLLPALLIGFAASRYSARFLDRGYIRPMILGLSGTAALIVLARFLF